MNILIAHPKLITLGIGLVITFAIGTAIGILDHGQIAFAKNYSSNIPSFCCDQDV